MAQTRLKQLREEAVLTVHELAEASGVSDDTISKIENGQRVARPNTLRKLAHALDVSPQELRRPARIEEPALAGKAEAPRETGPPRVSKERLEEHFENIRPAEVSYLDWVVADLWRLALPDEKPQAHFVPDDVDTARVWEFLNFVLNTPGLFVPEEVERINRGARKKALVGRG
jgi:transcriptional regulator with XRE-family HTH domain